MKPITIIIILVVVALLGWMVFRKKTISDIKENTSEVQPSKTSEDNTSSTSPKIEANAEKSFTVTGSNFAFSPNQISVKKGDKVTITFVNSNGTHDFKIDEFNVATKKMSGGEQEVITFVADKAGSFQYYCSIGSHRQMGMWGTLTVSE